MISWRRTFKENVVSAARLATFLVCLMAFLGSSAAATTVAASPTTAPQRISHDVQMSLSAPVLRVLSERAAWAPPPPTVFAADTGAGTLTWNPVDGPGPLGDEVAGTFQSATYTQQTLQDDLTLYRSYGGKVGPLGSYWTETPPSGPLQSQRDSALNPDWGNTADSVATIRVPAGTEDFTGSAAPQSLVGGCQLLGGGSQVYIPNVDPSWLVTP
jgi:hypothetical protein